MLYLLLLLSFIIHIVTFVIIRQLKLKQDMLTTTEDNVNQQVKNIEDTLAVYLVELKEENENFVKQVGKLNDNKSVNNKNKQEQQQVRQPVAEFDTSKDTTEYQPISHVEQVEDVVERSTTASVLHLHEKGHTVDEIAKKLDKGKTEVELLLKFQQKK
ncbi:hypothetical protein SAMN04487943_11345 [Gracilibacillus orientalis]|uniref:Uncharacterized protein n=2 Tax=Gracilibacillus orientalis TaxID=334253 RepID=A0A1I4PVI8_9BACI|nr:hypothetical protein [Gracilibacillus orientalis]SFM31798.1 hypothetical protein SAMN04487943_11345 [Gracilibacillus orientalis]